MYEREWGREKERETQREIERARESEREEGRLLGSVSLQASSNRMRKRERQQAIPSLGELLWTKGLTET